MTRVTASAFAIMSVIACTKVAQAAIVSVDFQTSVDGFFVDMAGVESNAAAADADFNASNVWNIANLTSHYTVAGSKDSNPSWANLVDSTGVATTAAFSITGDVVGTEVVGFGAQNALNEDGLFFDQALFGTSSTLSWEISGVTPGSSFKLYLNQLDVATWLPPQNRAMSGLIDTNGDGTPNEAYQTDFPGVLVTGTVAADGIIRGTSERAAGSLEPDWAGWQLSADIPPGPDFLSLEVNTTTGAVTLINSNDVESFEIDYYEILSLNSLNENGWVRLAGQAGFPPGDGSGNGWEDSGTPDASFLGEVYLDGTSTIAAGASINLGNAYNVAVDAQDLVFNYLVGNQTFQGDVSYVSSPGLPGDFNGDGVVDAADYTLWRDNLGAPDEQSINNNGDGGGISASDYQFWKQRFGDQSSGSLVADHAVPEPGTTALAFVGLVEGIGLLRRRSSSVSC